MWLPIAIILAFGGCTTTEVPNHIGAVPYYAVSNQPHPANCGCCCFHLKLMAIAKADGWEILEPKIVNITPEQLKLIIE